MRKQIGPAVWLLLLLLRFAPLDWSGDERVWAIGGNVVSDARRAAGRVARGNQEVAAQDAHS